MSGASWEAFDGRCHGPPSRLMWLGETRSIYEFAFSLIAAPLLLSAPRGDGHAVLVLPGFLAGDASTNALRRYLRLLGYDARPWKLGRNLGGIDRMRAALRRRLGEVHAESAQAVSLIGWSLGGVYARLLAGDMPHVVRSVITYGSPFSRDPRASNVSELYGALTGEGPTAAEKSAQRLFPHEFDQVSREIAAPSTSIFSKFDGIVSWRSSLLRPSTRSENIEVRGASHIGLGINAAVLWATADRLAQPHGTFAPFTPSGPFAYGYGLVG